MPFVRGPHNGRQVLLRVAIIEASRYAEHKRSEDVVLSGVPPFLALLDTGATQTMLAPSVVLTLGLDPVGKGRFYGSDGPAWRDTYLVHLGFYPENAAPVPQSVNGRPASRIQVYRQVIEPGELSYQTSFDVLLGMDVLSSGDLRINRDGTFGFEF